MAFVTGESGSKDKADRARSAVQNLCSECEGWIKYHSKKAIAWSRVYLVIGLPAAALAAVAGVTALASTAGRIPAGILAIASAGLGSAAAFLDSQGRQEKHDRLSRGFQALFIECQGYLEFETFNEEWLENSFPQEIVRLRKEYVALLTNQPLIRDR
jgi:hypothetical protein